MIQGQCGASYAFSALGALEGAWALAHGKLTTLSEQNIIDCSGEYIYCISQLPLLFIVQVFISDLYSLSSYISLVSYGNHGCHGGNMYNTYQYIISNEGVNTEGLYPFNAKVMEVMSIYNDCQVDINIDTSSTF